jgi:hypothetical protein
MAAEQVVERSALDQLFEALTRCGYAIGEPLAGRNAIVYDEIRTSAEPPVGWSDGQAPGRYRLTRRDDDALCRYVVSTHSLKPHLLAMQLTPWRARLSSERRVDRSVATAGCS